MSIPIGTDIAEAITDEKPTWELAKFDHEIPPYIQEDGRTKDDNYKYIIATVMERRLVYRLFTTLDGSPTEECRYVFFGDTIVEEKRDRTCKEVSATKVAQIKAEDVLCHLDALSVSRVYEDFRTEVDITKKQSILMIMPYIRNDFPKMGFKPFLEVYQKTRNDETKLEGVPQRIVRELYGRNHKTFSVVRIDKDLVVSVGERKCKYIYLKEQTRLYFDQAGMYYFTKNVATGFWERKDVRRFFELEQNYKERIVDKEIFSNTCAEGFAGNGIGNDAFPDKIRFGSVIAQVVFLSAEQAAKTDSRIFILILEGIYRRQITDKDMSLPETLGITGPQLKYLKDIRFPDNIKKFAGCMRDSEFSRHFPDVKKRIFAVSVYLTAFMFRARGNGMNRDVLFSGSHTICSIEKLSGDNRYRLADEYMDYLVMRKRYYEYAERMRPGDPLWNEIKGFGEPPVNIKPSKIHDQHNKLGNVISILSKKKTIEQYDPEIAEIREKEGKDIEYTDGSYSILMPSSAGDIIREGRMLHHCVGHGGYIERMARRQCRILFLRENKDITKPLITIEERNGKICQCYGFADSINRDVRIRDFIKEFASKRGWEIRAPIYSDGTMNTRMIGDMLTQEEINNLLAGIVQ